MSGEEPTAFEEFTILEVLGRGGMGVVYRASDDRLGREVALKVVRRDLCDTEQARRRFLREARAAATIEHANLVKVLRYGEWNGEPFLVMELVRGPNLEAVLADDRPEPAVVLAWLAPIAHALHRLHEAGILHRDVKPPNILIDRSQADRPVLTDLGVARHAQESALTRTGCVAGTPAYMSPEQARGEPVDPRTDVYSLGAVLYRALTGRRPFESTGSSGILEVATRQPAPVRSLDPGLSRDVAAICEKAMEPDRRNRYPTALAMAEDIDRFLVGEPIAARPPGPAARVRRRVQRHRWLVAGVSAALMALAGWRLGALGSAWRSRALDRAAVEAAGELVRGRAAEARTALIEGPADLEAFEAGYRPGAVAAEVSALLEPRGLTGASERLLEAYPAAEVESGISCRRAEAARDRSDPAAAALGFLDAYRRDPHGPWGRRALLEIGRFHQSAGRLGPARISFESYLADERTEEGDRAGAPLALADTLREEGLPDRAAGWYDEALRRGLEGPDAARAERSLAFCRLASGRLEAGREIWCFSPCDLEGDGSEEILVSQPRGMRRWRLEQGELRPVSPWIPDLRSASMGEGSRGHFLLCCAEPEGRRRFVIGALEPETWSFAELTSIETANTLEPSRIASADLDGDGAPEFVVGISDPEPERRILVASAEAGRWDEVLSELVGRSSVRVIRLADLDGDGRPELVAGIGPWNRWTVSVHRLEGRTPASEPLGIWFAGEPAAACVLDSDRDGRDEVYLLLRDPRSRVDDEILDSVGRALAGRYGPVGAPEPGDGLYRLAIDSGSVRLQRLLDLERVWDSVAMASARVGGRSLLLFQDGDCLRAVDPLAPDRSTWLPLEPATQVRGFADLDGDGDPEILLLRTARLGSLAVLGLGPPVAATLATEASAAGEARGEARDLLDLGFPEAALAQLGKEDPVLESEVLEALGRDAEALEAARRSGSSWREAQLGHRLGLWREASAYSGLGLDPVRGEAARRLAEWSRERSVRPAGLDLDACLALGRIRDPLLLRRDGSDGVVLIDLPGGRDRFDLELPLRGGSFELEAEIDPLWSQLASSAEIAVGAPEVHGLSLRTNVEGGGKPETWGRSCRIHWRDPRWGSHALERRDPRFPRRGLRFRIEVRAGERELVASIESAAGARLSESTHAFGRPFSPGTLPLRMLAGSTSGMPGRFRIRSLVLAIYQPAPISPGSPSWLEEAHRAYFEGRHADAARLYLELADAKEGDPELRIRAALAHECSGDRRQAEAALNAVPEEKRLAFLGRYLPALEARELGLFVRIWKDRLDGDLGTLVSDGNAAFAYRLLAIAALGERRPDDPRLFLNRAYLHHYSGRYEAARELLDRILAIDPRHEGALELAREGRILAGRVDE